MSGQRRTRSSAASSFLVALCLATVATLVVPATPASAAVPGLVRIATVSANNSLDFRSVTATCPVGKRLVGTGYEINGATGEVVIDDLRPNGGPALAPNAVTVGAYEADAFAGNWNITAYAICAFSLVGLARIAAVSATNSLDFRSVTATCPAGKRLLGTGYEINGATGEAVVDDFRPNGGPALAPNAVTVGAYEADAFAGNWNITAYAICAFPIAGLARVSAVSATNSANFRSVTATCPAGKVLTGGGYEVNGATGEAVVDDFRPNGGPITAPTLMNAGAYEEDAFSGNWSVTSYGICATR